MSSLKLTDPVTTITGIGPKTQEQLAQHDIHTVKELLLFLPLRYDDRSQLATVKQLTVGETQTVKARVVTRREYFKNRRRITSAKIKDDSGETKCIWFNNRYIKSRLEPGQQLYFSGKYTKYHTLTQPTIEKVEGENIHTARLVPLYSTTLGLAQGHLRRFLKRALDNLDKQQKALTGLQGEFLHHDLQRKVEKGRNGSVNEKEKENRSNESKNGNKNEEKEQVEGEQRLCFSPFLSLAQALKQVHFPDSQQQVRQARQRLALEELLLLIQHSEQIKQHWQEQSNAVAINFKSEPVNSISQLIPQQIPFTLTSDQLTACQEILTDLQSTTPMNRLLIGDVGSGKTVVGGVAAHHILQAGHHACLIAPTQILAKQHWQTFQTNFPQLQTQLLTADSEPEQLIATLNQKSRPTLFIGTHAVINQLKKIKPALIIYDEQHRFGVQQRSQGLSNQNPQPHILTMTATPIPRSYMLTIFSHLQASTIKQMPHGERPIKTWLVPRVKRNDAYQWVVKQLITDQESSNGHDKARATTKANKDNKVSGPNNGSNKDNEGKGAHHSTQTLAIIVCPFINPSEHEAFQDVPAATELFKQLESQLETLGVANKPQIALLHGQMKSTEKNKIIKQLFAKQIQILVTTSVVEVGVDLPHAKIMVIEGAERFGLASLHQLRGRVGRQGQQSYCLLFNYSSSQETQQRLQQFSQIKDGLDLAELDLENRGGGDLFGLEQSGFEQLQFASWSNLQLIGQARQIHQAIKQGKISWQPFFAKRYRQLKGEESKTRAPAAN